MNDPILGNPLDEQYVPMRMLSISQSIRFQKMVDAGQFASFEEAVNAHLEELNFVSMGNDTYSAEALNRLHEGFQQSERGESIDGEEVMAKLDALIRELEDRVED